MSENFVPDVFNNAVIDCPIVVVMGGDDDCVDKRDCIKSQDKNGAEGAETERLSDKIRDILDCHTKGMCYQGGKLYFGDVEDNLPNGLGTLINIYGEEYVGEFEKGKPIGMLFYRNVEGIRGRVKIDGDKVECIYRHTLNYRELVDKRVIDFVDGDRYIGEVNEFDRPHGLGELVGKRGTRIYGYFFEGVIHGVGGIEYANGTVIKGLFAQGRSNGFCYKQTKDNERYFARFMDGVLDGWGVRIDTNGNTYVELHNDGKLVKSVDVTSV